jgi:hypothetical protein
MYGSARARVAFLERIRETVAVATPLAGAAAPARRSSQRGSGGVRVLSPSGYGTVRCRPAAEAIPRPIQQFPTMSTQPSSDRHGIHPSTLPVFIPLLHKWLIYTNAKYHTWVQYRYVVTWRYTHDRSLNHIARLIANTVKKGTFHDPCMITPFELADRLMCTSIRVTCPIRILRPAARMPRATSPTRPTTRPPRTRTQTPRRLRRSTLTRPSLSCPWDCPSRTLARPPRPRRLLRLCSRSRPSLP